MDYFSFVASIKRMGTPLIIPNLGMQSLFYVNILENNTLQVINSVANSKVVAEDFFNTIRAHFCSLSGSECFLLGNYTHPVKNSVRGWTSKQGNPDIIFSGYVPAIFRELYARCGNMIADKSYYTSHKVKSYFPENWAKYTSNIEKVVEEFKYEEFLESIFKYNNKSKEFLKKVPKHHNLNCKIKIEHDSIICYSNKWDVKFQQANFSNAKNFILPKIKGKSAFFVLCFMFTLLSTNLGNLLDDVAVALLVEILKKLLIEEWKN
ncbi:MAG: hypothetical protein E7035_04565 [Verrucomicrobiaceae bacterium]|nr:hypothetical protein [Verrucomicrobiaceae bacterium]